MIKTARNLIQNANRIVAFSGAGLSAESGVPTFRDAATNGIWSKLDPMTLASPEGFARDPELVTNWYNERRRNLAGLSPNPAHFALAARRDIINVTQNVDDLLERAGAEDVIHVHGVLDHDRCHARCGYAVPIDLGAPPPQRMCPDCGAPVRPAVVWFGESLPQDEWHRAEAACLASDVLLVLGTSAEVYPAASLIDVARSAGAAIVVMNTNSSGASGVADVEVLGEVGVGLPRVLGG